MSLKEEELQRAKEVASKVETELKEITLKHTQVKDVMTHIHISLTFFFFLFWSQLKLSRYPFCVFLQSLVEFKNGILPLR